MIIIPSFFHLMKIFVEIYERQCSRMNMFGMILLNCRNCLNYQSLFLGYWWENVFCWYVKVLFMGLPSFEDICQTLFNWWKHPWETGRVNAGCQKDVCCNWIATSGYCPRTFLDKTIMITLSVQKRRRENHNQGILTNVCLLVSCSQIFYAVIDQTFFGEQPTPPTSSIVADLKRQYTSWKHVDGTHWEARFNHLLNYGAGNFELSASSTNLNLFELQKYLKCEI